MSTPDNMQIIDHGTVLIESKDDRLALVRYFLALSEGNYLYRPAHLRFKEHSTPASDKNNLEKYLFDTKQNINIINNPAGG